MASEEEIKNFPRPKPDNSLTAREKVIKKHQEQIQPLIAKRAKRARVGGSWKVGSGEPRPNADDPKNKRVEELKAKGEIE